MRNIAMLHTARATVPMMTAMIEEKYPEVKVSNWLDDSILPALTEDENNIEYVFEKMLCYARFAEKQGAELIFNACSSVGEFQDYAKGKLSIPVIRIDDAVTDLLTQRYDSVGVLATLGTTLQPSARLLQRKKPQLELGFKVVEGAWDAGLRGDKAEQDRLIAAAVEDFLNKHEAVFLAQASMAGAAAILPQDLQNRVYTSPQLAVEALGQYL